MPIPAANGGSLPRPARLQNKIAAYDAGRIEHAELAAEEGTACRDSIERFQATGAPIVSDGGAARVQFSPFSVDLEPRHGSPDFARDVAFERSRPGCGAPNWRPSASGGEWSASGGQPPAVSLRR